MTSRIAACWGHTSRRILGIVINIPPPALANVLRTSSQVWVPPCSSVFCLPIFPIDITLYIQSLPFSLRVFSAPKDAYYQRNVIRAKIIISLKGQFRGYDVVRLLHLSTQTCKWSLSWLLKTSRKTKYVNSFANCGRCEKRLLRQSHFFKS